MAPALYEPVHAAEGSVSGNGPSITPAISTPTHALSGTSGITPNTTGAIVIPGVINTTVTKEAVNTSIAADKPQDVLSTGKKEMNQRWLLNTRMGVDTTDRMAVQARRNKVRVECERLELPLNKAFYK
jgi:hypothetical protein